MAQEHSTTTIFHPTDENIATLRIGGYSSDITSVDEEGLAQRVRLSSVVVLDAGFVDALAQHLNRSTASVVRHVTDNGDGHCVPSVIVPSGEQGKGQSCFRALLEKLFSLKLPRDARMLAIGGGALCDLASYVASVYMRGMALTLVPSTLLSVVDASIGGKTAINFAHLKNMLGTFYPPSEVVVAMHLLETLNHKHIRDGLAEILKAGLLYDKDILHIFVKHADIASRTFSEGKSVWEKLIPAAIAVKAHFVQKDFKEQNIRAYLNLGHTFAHAHEASARKKSLRLSHGEAVGLGMRAAMHLGMRIKNSNGAAFTDTQYAEEVFSLLDKVDFPKTYEGYSSTEMIEYMKMDKKRKGSQLRAILQARQGETILRNVEEHEMLSVLKSLGAS